MSAEERRAMHARAHALLLSPVVIAAQDRINEAKEIADLAIALARVTSALEVMDEEDDGDD